MERVTFKAYKKANRGLGATVPISKVTKVIPNKKKVVERFHRKNWE
jgi:hypothetical protein